MRDTEATIDYLNSQRYSGTTSWYRLCEMLCRRARGLAAHYATADAHAAAIPRDFRHGHEMPRRGDLVLYRNGGSGHIATATGSGWTVFTNDYGGRGRVTLADARLLVRWCSAREWFVADAWWSRDNVMLTHRGILMPSRASVRRAPAGTWARGAVYYSKLHYGQRDSDSVRRLQYALNRHPLKGGQTLPITGNFLGETDEEVRLCQAQHGKAWGEGKADARNSAFVGPRQAAHLLKGYTLL